MKRIIFVFLIAFLTACVSSNKQEVSKEEISTDRNIDIPEPDILERLSAQKNNLDSLIIQSELIEKSYYKFFDKEELLETSVDNIEDNMEIEKTYYTWENSLGEIVVVGEYPYSQSGDWSAGYVHYFDEKGATFAIEASSSYFIEEGIATESTIDYYNSNFVKVESKYSLLDEHQTILEEEKYGHRYQQENDAYENVEVLLETKKIK